MNEPMPQNSVMQQRNTMQQNATLQAMEKKHQSKKFLISLIIIAIIGAAIGVGYLWWKQRQEKKMEPQTFEELMNQPIPEITAAQRAAFDAAMQEPVPAQSPAEQQAFTNLMLEGTSATTQ